MRKKKPGTIISGMLAANHGEGGAARREKGSTGDEGHPNEALASVRVADRELSRIEREPVPYLLKGCPLYLVKYYR